MVLRFHGNGMTEGTRVLLIVMGEQMDRYRKVSIPRNKLAECLGVAPRTIFERIRIAIELGLLVSVLEGRPGRTAEYQGTFPSGSHVRTKTVRRNAIKGEHVLPSTSPDKGEGELPLLDGRKGEHVPTPSSKRSSPEASGLDPIESGLDLDSESRLALASTALSKAPAEDTRVRTTESPREKECGQLASTATSRTTKPTDLSDEWTPNAQHRVMMANRSLDPAEVVDEFRGTYAAVFERRRNWDTTFARFIIDFADDQAMHWSVA